MATTIQISDQVKQILDKMKIMQRESYNDVIEILLEDSKELSEQTKRELREREKEKTISHEEVKKRLGL